MKELTQYKTYQQDCEKVEYESSLKAFIYKGNDYEAYNTQTSEKQQ